MITHASELYCAAAGISPCAHGVATEDSFCVMCGTSITAGSAANPLSKSTFDAAFNNRLDLRAPTGRYVCGACDSLWTTDWLQKYSKTFATSQGVYKFASNDQQAALLLNPPAPPFCVIFNTRQQQHMIWRTPVSLSRDFYVVRVDGDVLTIRQAKLLDAWRAYQHALTVMADTPLARTGRKLKPPAAIFDRELGHRAMGTLRTDVMELLTETGNAWVIDLLHGLSMGEWWALNVIRNYNPDSPPAYQLALSNGVFSVDDPPGAEEI